MDGKRLMAAMLQACAWFGLAGKRLPVSLVASFALGVRGRQSHKYALSAQRFAVL